MPKKLSGFKVLINLPGWSVPGGSIYGEGQVVVGKHIHPRMIKAIENGETFKTPKGKLAVCQIIDGGTLEELKQAMAAPDEEDVLEVVVKKPPVKETPKVEEKDPFAPGVFVPKNERAVIGPIEALPPPEPELEQKAEKPKQQPEEPTDPTRKAVRRTVKNTSKKKSGK